MRATNWNKNANTVSLFIEYTKISMIESPIKSIPEDDIRTRIKIRNSRSQPRQGIRCNRIAPRGIHNIPNRPCPDDRAQRL